MAEIESTGIERSVTSGQLVTGTSHSKYLLFQWWLKSQDIQKNSSTIGFSLTGAGTGTGYIRASDFYLSINGTKILSPNDTRIYLYVGTDVLAEEKVTTREIEIPHNSNGEKSFTAYAEGALYAFDVNVKTPTDTYWELPAIPRYANFTQHRVSDLSVNSITVSLSVDSTCDAIQYSLNNGNWVTISNFSSYVITGLNDNTQYSIRTRVKRTDSQLWTTSSYIYGTTLPRATLSTGNPNVSNGNTLYVRATNTSGTTCRIRLLTIKDGVATTRYTKNTSEVTFTVAEINALMQYFPNNPSFTIRAVVDTMRGSTVLFQNYKDGIYTITNSNPVFENFTFLDVDSSTPIVTGSNQYIVKNKSKLRVVISANNKMVAQNYATPVRYEITCGNRSGSMVYGDTDKYLDLGTITSAGTKSIVVKAYDSRGFFKTKSITITVIDYNDVIQNNEMYRINNFENETKLKIKGSFSLLTCGGVVKNTIKRVRYRIKEDGGTFGDYINLTPVISSNSYECDLLTHDLDNTKSFITEVKVTDNFDIEKTNTIVTTDGVPIMFVNTSKKNVGVGTVNENSEYSLEVKGNIITQGKIILSSGNEVLDWEVVDEW